jgi:hypothetical protein
MGAKVRPRLLAAHAFSVPVLPLTAYVSRPYAVGGWLLTALVVLSLLIADEGLRVFVLGIGAAVVLWGVWGWGLGRYSGRG